jgi:hypothetical protein
MLQQNRERPGTEQPGRGLDAVKIINSSLRLNNSLMIVGLNDSGPGGRRPMSAGVISLGKQASQQKEEIMETLMTPERSAANILERALEKAAKIICTLQYGRCPVQEENFPRLPQRLP